jgi:hypothetical protein
MFNPFSRSPITAQDWQERARLFQEQINGLSIDELMRGVGIDAVKRGESSGRTIPWHEPDQPDEAPWNVEGDGRVVNDPRIVSDATPDNQWLPDADYAGVGHHWVTQQFYRRMPFSRETKRVFRDATSGPIPLRAYDQNRQTQFRHIFDQRHRQYNAALEEFVKSHMNSNGITAQQMTPDQARDILRAVRWANDPRIQSYNAMIKFLRGMYRFRTGGRGSE